MSKCPNKNLPEYKKLITYLGSEELAFRAYIANGEEIPDIEQLKDKKYKEIIDEVEVKPRFQLALDNLKQRQSNVLNKIKTLENSIQGRFVDKSKVTAEAKVKVKKEVKALNKQLEAIEQQLAEIKGYNAIEQIVGNANSQLDEVNGKLKSGNFDENDFLAMINTINLWKEAGNFSDNKNIFFTDEELDLSDDEDSLFHEIKKQFADIGFKASELERKWVRLRVKALNQILAEKYGDKFQISLDDALKDVGMMESLLLPISSSDNYMAQAVYDWNAKAGIQSARDLSTVFNQLDAIFEPINKRFTKSELHEKFSQTVSNTDSRKTSDLVHRFSQSFFVYRHLLKEALHRKLKDADDIENLEERKKTKALANKEFNEKFKEISIIFDARKLFPDKDLYEGEFSEADIQAHKQELLSSLGQNGYDEYIAKFQDKINRFKEDRRVQQEILAEDYGDGSAQYMQELSEYDLENSPYYYAEQHEQGFKHTISGKYVSPNGDSVIIIPKRIVKGKDTGFYDKKFEAIESDLELYALYNTMFEIIHEMNSYLPSDMQRELQVNTLNQVNKSVLELFTGGNMPQGFVGIWDSLKESLREGIGQQIESSEETDVYGNKIQQINTDFIVKNDKEIKNYIERKEIEYRQQNQGKNKKVLETEIIIQKREWERDIKDKLAKDTSPDIEKSIKAYAMAAIAYKHKSQIYEPMMLAKSFLDDLIKQKENISGEEIRDQFWKPFSNKKESPEMFKKQLGYFFDAYLGNKSQAAELVTKKKLYTTEETATKEELQKLIVKEDDPEAKYKLQKQLDELGGFTTGSRWLDMLNQITRVRALAWNPLSSVSNASFGYVSNSIEAVGGQYLTNKGLAKGYKEVLSNSKKVTNILNNNSLLNEMQSEVYDNRANRATKGWLAPFALMSKTEVLNQGSLVVGIFDKIKVKLNGEEISLYDAINDEGNLKDGVEFLDGMTLENAILLAKDRVIETHGNYDKYSPIRANKHVLGRSLLVFRKWMINSYYGRLKGYQPTNIYGIDSKGRWRSYSDYFKEYGAAGGIFGLTMNLLKKMTFGAIKTDFGKLNELDASNMKKNLQEIAFLFTVSILALMLKAMQDDDDDDAKFLAIFWINQLTRIQTDLLFYVDPSQFKTMLKDPVPLMSIVNDGSKAVGAALNLISGGNDTYRSGPNKDSSKARVAAFKFIGGPVSLPGRIESYYSQMFDKENNPIENIVGIGSVE